MQGHQILRTVGIVGVLGAYIARLVYVGNGLVTVLGYQMDPIGLVAVAILILAAPETLEHLPFGPSKNKS